MNNTTTQPTVPHTTCQKADQPNTYIVRVHFSQTAKETNGGTKSKRMLREGVRK